LADYMAASEQRRRTIIRGCKYRPIARLVQHDKAKAAVAKFIRDGGEDEKYLIKRAKALRNHAASWRFFHKRCGRSSLPLISSAGAEGGYAKGDGGVSVTAWKFTYLANSCTRF